MTRLLSPVFLLLQLFLISKCGSLISRALLFTPLCPGQSDVTQMLGSEHHNMLPAPLCVSGQSSFLVASLLLISLQIQHQPLLSSHSVFSTLVNGNNTTQLPKANPITVSLFLHFSISIDAEVHLHSGHPYLTRFLQLVVNFKCLPTKINKSANKQTNH